MGETRFQKPKAKGRTYVKATFTGYRRGLRNQHDNTALLKLENVFNPSDAKFYLGKKCVYMWKATKPTKCPGRDKWTRVRASWGKITRTHGNAGGVRAQFKRNLPAEAMGKRIRVMLYPSNI